MTGGQTDDARAVIVTNADYRWCPGARIDDGKLVTGESDQPVLSGEDLFATVPHGTYLELDGSLTDLAGGIAKKLGPIQSVTYRYSTQKIQMLLPYTIAQPLLTNPVAPPPEPTDVAPLASDTFFGGAQPILVTVEGTAWLRRSWWVVYAQMECKPLASAFRPRLTWRAAANEPKGSRGTQARVNHPAQRQEPALGHQGPEVLI